MKKNPVGGEVQKGGYIMGGMVCFFPFNFFVCKNIMPTLEVTPIPRFGGFENERLRCYNYIKHNALGYSD